MSIFEALGLKQAESQRQQSLGPEAVAAEALELLALALALAHRHSIALRESTRKTS